MNKLFTKIGTAMVGIAMAIGVGIVASQKQSLNKAEAVTGTTEFELVTNVSSLASGDHVLIGGLYTRTDSQYSEYHFINTVSNGNSRKTTVATVTDNKLTIGTSDIMYFTVGGSSGAWTFSTNGYAGTAGYLNTTDTTSNNYLKVIANLDNYAYFNISSINSTTGEATITCNGKNSKNIMYVNGSYNKNGNPKHTAGVSCYDSKTEANYSKPRIYKEVSSGPQVVYTPEAIRIEDESLIKKTYFTGDDWNNSTFNVQLVKGGNDEPKTYQYVDLTENLTFVYKNSSSETMSSPATASGVTLTITSSDYSSLPAFVSSPFDVVVKSIPSTHYDLDLSTDQTDDAAETYLEWDKQYVYVLVDKADATTNANNYYPGTSGKSYTSTRFYKDSVLTISPVDGYPLVAIDFEATSESYATTLGNSSWTNAIATVDGTSVRVILDSNTADVECTLGGNCGFTEISFFYEKSWSRNFLDTFTCTGVVPEEHPDGDISVANPTTVWSSLADLLDNNLKSTLKTLEADENGTVDQQAMARYDLVIRKYGIGTYSDFIGRFSTGGVNASIKLGAGDNDSINSSVVIITTISAVIIMVTMGGIFFIRRRKEDK